MWISSPGRRGYSAPPNGSPGQGVVIGTTKTASGRRPIALGAGVVALLRRHRAEQKAEYYRWGWDSCFKRA